MLCRCSRSSAVLLSAYTAITFAFSLLVVQYFNTSSLETTGFVFDEAQTDHIVISGIPVNITESEVSLVIEQLLSDLQDGIPANSYSQNDTIAKSMAKSLAVKTGSYLTEKEQDNLVNGLFACKDPNISPFQKPTFITMRVEDIDKKFAL